MTYEILRGNQRIPVEEPVTLTKELGPDYTTQVTIWQGRNEKLGPYGYEVDDNSLNIRRKPLIAIPGRNARVDDMVTVSPEYCQAGDAVIDLAGEEIRIIYQAD